MAELFFGPGAVWFTVPALLGTVFFTLRLILMLVGGVDGGADADAGGDLDTDFDGADSDHATEAFKVLSIQAIAAFFMGAGWGGLGALRGAGWSPLMSGAFGVACGVGMMWLLGKLMTFMHRLQSSGNVFIHQALGIEGTVYASVPATGRGRGRVRVVVDDHERFYAAVSSGAAIASKERVRVVEVNEDNTLTVEPIS